VGMTEGGVVHFCQVCGTNVSGDRNWEQHLKGKAHAKKMKMRVMG